MLDNRIVPADPVSNGGRDELPTKAELSLVADEARCFWRGLVSCTLEIGFAWIKGMLTSHEIINTPSCMFHHETDRVFGVIQLQVNPVGNWGRGTLAAGLR